MKNQLIELKYSIIYCILSTFISILIVFLNKEYYWLLIINKLNINLTYTIVTNYIELFITYLKFSILIGMVFSINSWILIMIMFFSKGLYRKEFNTIVNWLSLILIVNILIYPYIFKTLTYYLLNPLNIYMNYLGKFSEILKNIENIWWISQLIWLIPLILKFNIIKKYYIANRNWMILIIYICISIISPPDVILTSIIVGTIFLILEILIFIYI